MNFLNLEKITNYKKAITKAISNAGESDKNKTNE